jgi:ribosome biogenesis SPOUT family RNA methylase Rps3
MATSEKAHTFIVEHLDPELESWQALEYRAIYQECTASGATFILSGVADPEAVQKQLQIPLSSIQKSGIDKLYPTPEDRKKVCLLDPKGAKDICPEDGEEFDAFLFGGILGDDPPRGIVLSYSFSARRHFHPPLHNIEEPLGPIQPKKATSNN